MYTYTASNKNLARATFIIGFRHFITTPNAYFGLKSSNGMNLLVAANVDIAEER